jgi:hypothetical protein
MNNFFNPNTVSGSAFGSISADAPSAAPNKQSTGSHSAYRPTSISAHSTGSTKICMDCHNQFPLKAVTEIHPVPGLTMYRCCGCVTVEAAKAAVGTDPTADEFEEFDPGKAWAKAWLGGD